MRRIVSLVLVVLLLSLAVGCSSDDDNVAPGESSATGGTDTPIELVPQKANLLGYVDVGRLLADSDIASAFEDIVGDAADAQTMEQSLEELLGTIDIEEVLVFADLRNL